MPPGMAMLPGGIGAILAEAGAIGGRGIDAACWSHDGGWSKGSNGPGADEKAAWACCCCCCCCCWPIM